MRQATGKNLPSPSSLIVTVTTDLLVSAKSGSLGTIKNRNTSSSSLTSSPRITNLSQKCLPAGVLGLNVLIRLILSKSFPAVVH